MGSPIVHSGATVICAHGGQASATSPSPRVKVGGQPVVTQPKPFSISGCSFPPQSGGPCATAQWLVAAVRVTAGGEPVVISSSTSTCVPTGTPLTIVQTQTRVTAT